MYLVQVQRYSMGHHCCLLVRVCSVLFIARSAGITVEAFACGKGEFLSLRNSGQQCVPCEAGTFMPAENHVNEYCIPCKKADKYIYQIEIEPCTLTSDTVIGCVFGWYKAGLPGHEECQKCTKCEDLNLYVGQECGSDRDTVCCSQSGMTVKTDASGSQICVDTPDNSAVIYMCRVGHFLNYAISGKPRCSRCPNGTFISEPVHNFRQCESCSEARQYLHQVAVKPCTVTSDTVIGCARGYYKLKKPHHEKAVECLRCSKCGATLPLEMQSCTLDSDTICCPSDSMKVTTDDNGNNICVPKTSPTPPLRIQCRKGQYLLNNQTCGNCQKGTFMSKDHHRYMDCQPCQRGRAFLHEVEKRPCTATTDTVIHCVEGYFRAKLTGVLGNPEECQKCSECKYQSENHYEGKKCELYKDTVCCPSPRMTVTVNEDGISHCVNESDLGKASTCGNNQYLFISESGQRECRPCPAGTFVSNSSPSSTQCTLCHLATGKENEAIVKKCQQVLLPTSSPSKGQDNKLTKSRRKSTSKRKCRRVKVKKKCRRRRRKSRRPRKRDKRRKRRRRRKNRRKSEQGNFDKSRQSKGGQKDGKRRHKIGHQKQAEDRLDMRISDSTESEQQ